MHEMKCVHNVWWVCHVNISTYLLLNRIPVILVQLYVSAAQMHVCLARARFCSDHEDIFFTD